MKKLLIYYSLSGNGDTIAETLRAQGCDVRKVIPKKKPPKAFFFQILAGGSARASAARNRFRTTTPTCRSMMRS